MTTTFRTTREVMKKLGVQAQEGNSEVNPDTISNIQHATQSHRKSLTTRLPTPPAVDYYEH